MCVCVSCMLTLYSPLGPLKIFACSARAVIHLCSVTSNKPWLRRASACCQDLPDAPPLKATQLQLTYLTQTRTHAINAQMEVLPRCKQTRSSTNCRDGRTNTAVSIKNGWSFKDRGGCRYLSTPVTLTSVGSGGGATRVARQTSNSYLSSQNIPYTVVLVSRWQK